MMPLTIHVVAPLPTNQVAHHPFVVRFGSAPQLWSATEAQPSHVMATVFRSSFFFINFWGCIFLGSSRLELQN